MHPKPGMGPRGAGRDILQAANLAGSPILQLRRAPIGGFTDLHGAGLGPMSWGEGFSLRAYHVLRAACMGSLPSLTPWVSKY